MMRSAYPVLLLCLLCLCVLIMPLPASAATAKSKGMDAEREIWRMMQQRVTSCWSVVPVNMPLVEPIVRFTLDRKGALTGAEVANHSEDPAFSMFAETALRAVKKCGAADMSAYADHYDIWHEVFLNFRPDTTSPQPWKNKSTTSTTLRRIEVVDGKKRVSLKISARSWDDRKVEARLTCPAEKTGNDQSIGIHFGTPMDMTMPQSVAMMFGMTTDRRDYRPDHDYLVMYGADAAAHIKQIAGSKGYLEFAGAGGVSAFFDLTTSKSALNQFLKLCGVTP
ncbi:cell envelope integrity protein TolA [Rhizobium skierniewicense]|uniref:cell envelope integrity protein TolA n=1 Tax=Rhizobium skierniewicense TaxID=984260 RepID=UPI0015727C2D|nr:cell envelope integrity protein TolA [Rhizobium skierniewicense]NTF31465.1 hypothetical protein [Rhizobium skierniewicense]